MSHDVVCVKRTIRTQAEADELKANIVAKAMANETNNYIDAWESLSEPARNYWRRKARVANQTLKDLAL